MRRRDAAGRSTNRGVTPELEPESLAIGNTHLTIDLAKAACLAEEGSAADVINKEKSIDLVVVHAGAGEYYVLLPLCTHACACSATSVLAARLVYVLQRQPLDL